VLLARLEAGSRLLRMERQLRKNSCHDPLTGVLNRRAFQDRFAQEWGRAARYGHPLSCAVLDLDFFKRVNDTHGHAAGDAALVGVASLLTNLCRPSDIVCRCGGEEFSVLLTETNETGAVRWAERIRLALAGTTIPAAGVVLRLTASLGVAERLADTTSPDQLRELADQALAVAKQSGRNRVVRFSSLNEPMLDRPEQLAHPLDSIVARDVMSAPIYCPHQDETVRQAADLFLQLRLTSAPVVNDAGTLVGIVTDADLLTRTALGKGWDDKIRNVMRTDVVCYNEDAPLDQVYQFLARVSVPRIVVVDQGRPTGVISRSTLLRWFRNWAASRLPAEWSAAFARLAGTLWRRVRPRVPAGAWRSSLRRKTTLRQEY
jgi:diguanylate cyclase (GGDEF)-like protein